MSDPYIPQLHPNGERKAIPKPLAVKSEQPPEIKNDNIKVQRLRDIVSWSPWDQLFDVTARWGHAHNIKIVFFSLRYAPIYINFKKTAASICTLQISNALPRNTRSPLST